MDFVRTLKKRRPKKHVPARVSVASPVEARRKRRLVLREQVKKILTSRLSE
jgi:hypothetical protein